MLLPLPTSVAKKIKPVKAGRAGERVLALSFVELDCGSRRSCGFSSQSSVLLKRIGFADRDAVPRGNKGSAGRDRRSAARLVR
ncbi:hypothetical protein D3Y57_02085 (plasmid) [Sphingomonas paeninsulae]|uniref:Uncharacterized protein n=1 Tax=Sphingomonas paeninsulae TaxID=2319844 RepID=A0A494TCS3_SPHPE|nr:hypothetical protein D3Y57_02085 [Sphingomonas paeninsulae]